MQFVEDDKDEGRVVDNAEELFMGATTFCAQSMPAQRHGDTGPLCRCLLHLQIHQIHRRQLHIWLMSFFA